MTLAPPSDSVGWKDPSVSPNEAAEAAWDLDCKQENQSRIQRGKSGEGTARFFFPARPSRMLAACNFLQLRYFYSQATGLQPTLLFLDGNGGLESFLEPSLSETCIPGKLFKLGGGEPLIKRIRWKLQTH